jgi:hypothetical protein
MAHDSRVNLQTSTPFPPAPARLLADVRGFRWLVPNCPACGKRHVHGGGTLRDDPRGVLSHRAAHCYQSGGYILVDSDPTRTARILAAVASSLARGVRTAL